LRTTCTIEFAAAQTIARRTVPAMSWTGIGAARMPSRARRNSREAARRARWPRMRGGRRVGRALIASGMTHPLSNILAGALAAR
jgi:hypothetical protein